MNSTNGNCGDESYRYWPIQKTPKAIVLTSQPKEMGRLKPADLWRLREKMGPTFFMLQSVAGLTAKAVNEGVLDEMVWTPIPIPSYRQWYDRIVNRLAIEERGPLSEWELVERYRDKGIIKGYILYSWDQSSRGDSVNLAEIDVSANVATSLAGPFNAIIVDESLQEKTEQVGLKMLLDVRGKDMLWCLEKYGDKIYNGMALTVDPRTPNNRAAAVAYNAPVSFGTGVGTEAVMAYLRPSSPILGWNIGDEDKHTSLNSKYGHYQTATSMLVNMPVLAAGSHDYEPKRCKSLDPTTIDYDQGRHFVAFLMSDGDNTGWFVGSFTHDTDYWANPQHGKFPMGWTTSMANASQMAPDVADYIAETKPQHTSLIEQGGGYYYPDLFAKELPNRREILAKHAREVNHYLKRRGVNILSFICLDIDSPEAMEAYAVFAKEMDALIGMIGLQYYPYDGGDGAVYWFKNNNGIEIPVVCVKYSIWNHANWPRGGTPAKIARLIKEQALEGEQQGKKTYSITSVHCWSYFKKSDSDADDAEEIGKDSIEYRKDYHVGRRGLTPVKWCVDRLSPEVKVVSPEEIIWRIRMRNRPEQTLRVLKQYY